MSCNDFGFVDLLNVYRWPLTVLCRWQIQNCYHSVRGAVVKSRELSKRNTLENLSGVFVKHSTLSTVYSTDRDRLWPYNTTQTHNGFEWLGNLLEPYSSIIDCTIADKFRLQYIFCINRTSIRDKSTHQSVNIARIAFGARQSNTHKRCQSNSCFPIWQ